MVLRAVINLVDDSQEIQTMQVASLDGNTPDDVEHLQPLGLTSVPMKDAECAVLAVGGNVDHPVAIGVQDRSYRPTGLSEGETQVYDKTGSKMYFKSSGDMALAPSGAFVHVGGDPADVFIAKADLTDTRIGALETAHNALVLAFNTAVALYNVHIHTSTATFKPEPPPPAGTGTTVTVAAPTPPQVVAAAHTPGNSVAATKGKVT